MNRCKTVNWNKVMEKVETQQWAASLVDVLKQDFDNHISAWPADPPLERSEWGHYYFCTDCGVKLKFDITRPHAHICPKCDKTYSGWPYDGAWRKIMHSSIVSNMERAVILAHMPQADSKYGQYIHDTVLFYANNYSSYPEYGKHAGRGKVYPQSLSEAIFVIAIERILRLSADLSIFNESEYQTIGQLFFRPALRLLQPQIGRIHNIHAWMQAAVAACASFLNDRKLLEETIYGKFGWVNQLQKGVSEEGIWYELSSTYHYYTLNALMSLAWIALENDIDLFNTPAFTKMASNYIYLVYPNGRFPAYNDGWFGSNIFQVCSVYEQLSGFDHSFEPLLAWIYDNSEPRPYECLNSLFSSENRPTGHARASLSALLYGPSSLPKAEPPQRKSFLYKDIGLAVLQNDNLRVSLKFSRDGGGHDHNDKNSIEIYANGQFLSYDVGTTGYGLPFTQEWSRTSISHNMVCINYQRQSNCRAVLLNYDGKSVCAQANEAYKGVSLIRKLSLEENGFNDVFEVKCGKDSQIDWIFHCIGQIETDLDLEYREPFAEGNGYNQLFDLKRAFSDEDFCVSFLTDVQRVDMHFKGEKNTEIVIGKCYGFDKTDILSFIMLRRHGKNTVFSQRTRFYTNN